MHIRDMSFFSCLGRLVATVLLTAGTAGAHYVDHHHHHQTSCRDHHGISQEACLPDMTGGGGCTACVLDKLKCLARSKCDFAQFDQTNLLCDFAIAEKLYYDNCAIHTIKSEENAKAAQVFAWVICGLLLAGLSLYFAFGSDTPRLEPRALDACVWAFAFFFSFVAAFEWISAAIAYVLLVFYGVVMPLIYFGVLHDICHPARSTEVVHATDEPPVAPPSQAVPYTG